MAALSWDDFHKLQNQLIELRSANCSLEESNRRQTTELTTLRSRFGILQAELDRAQKSLNAKKKAKDFEHLLIENERLQQKLVSQEEEFRLQNRTVLEELNQVCVTKEKLESELSSLKAAVMESEDDSALSAAGCRNQSASQNDERIARLEAENAALRSSRARAAEEHEQRVKELRDVVERLTGELSDRSKGGEEDEDGGGGGGGEAGAKSPADRCVSPTEDNAGFVHIGGDAPSSSTSVSKLLAESRQRIELLEAQLKRFDDWVVERDTLLGEKQTFVARLQAMEDEYQRRMGELEDKCKEAQEKLVRKQESYMQLHKEKELLLESGKREVQVKSGECEKLREMCNSLQTQLEHSDARHSEVGVLHQKLDETMKLSQAKDAKLVAVQEKLQESSAMKLVLESQLVETKQELDQSRRETEALRRDCTKLRERLSSLETQLNHATQESWEQQAKLQDLIKTAEKRKALIDEMARTIQSQNEKHMSEMTAWNDKNVEQIRRLEADLKLNEETIAELKPLVAEIQKERETSASLSARVAALEASLDENRKSWQAELAAEKEAQAELQRVYEAKCDEVRAEAAADVAVVRADVTARDETICELELKLDRERASVLERDDVVDRLRRDVADAEERAKLCDKKHRGINKDLKRQLAVERKRAESLEARLSEMLADVDKTVRSPRSGSTVEVRSNSSGIQAAMDVDACSNGSWSMMSGKSNNNNHASNLSNNNNGFVGAEDTQAFDIGVQTSSCKFPTQKAQPYSKPVEFADPLLGETSSSESIQSARSGKSAAVASTKRRTADAASEAGLSTEEVQSLLHRVAQLQQDKWTMEERVRILEESSAAMSDAVLQKSALIQYYCMEGRADARKSSLASGSSPNHVHRHDILGESGNKPAVRRIVDFLKASSTTEDQIRGVNKRMQRVVEETLTKNMHLQQSMEELSNEVVVLKERVKALMSVSGQPK